MHNHYLLPGLAHLLVIQPFLLANFPSSANCPRTHLLANNTPFSLLNNLSFMIHALSAHCTVSPSHYKPPCATLQCTAYKPITFSVQHLLLALQLFLLAVWHPQLPVHCVQSLLLALQLLLLTAHCTAPPACCNTTQSARYIIHLINLISLPLPKEILL